MASERLIKSLDSTERIIFFVCRGVDKGGQGWQLPPHTYFSRMEGTAGQQRCAALLLAPQFEEAIDAPGVHVRPWLPGAPVTDTHATTPRARRSGGAEVDGILPSIIIIMSTDYGSLVWKSPSLHGRKSNPNPKFKVQSEHILSATSAQNFRFL